VEARTTICLFWRRRAYKEAIEVVEKLKASIPGISVLAGGGNLRKDAARDGE